MKLILESWRGYVSEQEEDPDPRARRPSTTRPARMKAGAGAQALVQKQDAGLHDYVSMLKQIASDPEFRKLASAGRKDAGGPQDEAISIDGGSPVAAKNLTPTQKDIDLDKSLGDQMTNKWDPPSTEAALSKGTIMMPSPGGTIPLLVFENKYILDGHHRWSQVMMTNPDGIMAVDNMSAPAFGTGEPGAEKALKATQLAIAALAGKVVTKDTKKNLLAANENYIYNYVVKYIQPPALQALHAAGKISAPDATKEAAKMYAANLAAIKAKPPGKFDRVKGMPQADDSGVPQAKVNKALEKGSINFNDPQAADIQGAASRRRAPRPVAENTLRKAIAAILREIKKH